MSYKIVGIAFKVFKELGFGYPEKYYQRAFELELKTNQIRYKREEISDLIYRAEKIGNYRLDFIIEDRIILEVKVGEYFHNKDFSQIKSYLKRTGLKLGILVLFSPDGVKFERILAAEITINQNEICRDL